MSNTITIPYDIYESQHEFVIIVPLGGVKKESIELKIVDYVLHITGKRAHDALRDDCISLRQDCFRGTIHFTIDLPTYLAYKQIHSSLSRENILTIIIPKNIIPDHITIKIDE